MILLWLANNVPIYFGHNFDNSRRCLFAGDAGVGEHDLNFQVCGFHSMIECDAVRIQPGMVSAEHAHHFLAVGISGDLQPLVFLQQSLVALMLLVAVWAERVH